MNNYSIKKFRTNLLFPRTDFIRGMGSVLHIGSGYFKFNFSKSGFDTDAKSIASDWGMVGQDMKQVFADELAKNKSVGQNERKKE